MDCANLVGGRWQVASDVFRGAYRVGKDLQRKRLLLLQDRLPPFRKPVYNGLAEYYDITVIHSGEPRTTASDQFREVVHPVRHRGPLWIRECGRGRPRTAERDRIGRNHYHVSTATKRP